MEERTDMKVEITRKMDHYEVYIDGQFFCSADTAMEAACEVDKYLAGGREVVNA